MTHRLTQGLEQGDADQREAAGRPLDFRGRIFGAHTSIAGGVTQAIGRAVACGFTGAQIFVKSNHQWSATPLGKTEVEEFRSARQKANLFVFGHTGYLINLGGKEPAKAEKSLQSLVLESERAEDLGLPFLVLHPGSHGGDGEEAGLQRIARQLNAWEKLTRTFKVKIALESTAGTGGHLGYKLEHLRVLLDLVERPDRFGVCLDTAHLFAAGYPIHERTGYDSLVKEVQRVIGLENLLAFHVNDTPCLLGSRKDRHEHLGRGRIGAATFEWLVQDKTWEKIPMILETPKSEDMHEDLENLVKLKKALAVS